MKFIAKATVFLLCFLLFGSAWLLAQNAVPLPEMELLALPLRAIDPAGNRSSAEKIELGRWLFFDPLLSATQRVACATCHHPDYAWADGRATALGVGGEGLGPKRLLVKGGGAEPMGRNSLSLLNVAFNGLLSGKAYDPREAPMFVDLRESGLEAQVFHPIRALAEMRGKDCPESQAVLSMVRRVESVAGYQEKFAEVFAQDKQGAGKVVTADKVSAAIAAFERSLVANDTPFDRFMRGDPSALTKRQQKGMKTFEKAGCVHCHGGPMFSDFKLHFIDVTGTGRDDRQPLRTPTLRNLRYTAPYFHHGRKRTLREVLVFYEKLMDAAAEVLDGGAETEPPFDPLLKHLHLEAEDFAEVLDFLEALNGENWDKTIPDQVPSGLKVGGE